jgi:mono/diheme cytochrome c family protein
MNRTYMRGIWPSQLGWSMFLISLLTLLPRNLWAQLGDSALPGNHPLNQLQSGELLVAELRCAACHRGITRDPLFEKAAPDLSEAGSRISPEYLRRFLASPASMHATTTMPDILAARPAEERDAIAESLTHFLVSISKSTFQAEASSKADNNDGRALYHSVGCVACHGPVEPHADAPLPSKEGDEEDEEDENPAKAKKKFRPTAFSLSHVPAKYSIKSLSDFLFQPLHVRSSGRMPDMKLTPAESRSIAEYLLREKPTDAKELLPQASKISEGRKYFEELRCTACHTLPGVATAPMVGSIRNLDGLSGCLSKASGRGPQFQLDAAQSQAILAALRQQANADTEEVVLAKTLTAFNCVACHIRGGYGGVHETYNPYFETSEKNLGEDGRIPPPLTLVGAKLQTAWLKKVLFDGESVRPYMATRMPQYGANNLKHLPDLVAKLDILEGADIDIPKPEGRSEKEREREKLLRTAGRELLGDKGVNCVACHNFNGKPAPINKGIDLMTSYQRLQPKWFNRFVRNPGSLRPRIVMPYSWSDGIAAHKTILDGNTDMQIEAIWYYLSLGTSAADPSGIRNVSTKLAVDEQTRTYRGRSRVAGFRGIAVGFPQKVSYAFNAETGTLSAIWLGDFIGVNWNGQGSGDFNPASEPITLAQDVSFAKLADENASWPLMPVMTKEARLNPDPLYPKNMGYQFRGYFIDDISVPTFMYRSGTIEIEDRTIAIESNGLQQLKRTIQLASPVQQDVWFRALAGEITQESAQLFRSGRLKLMVPAMETKLRPFADDPNRFELLLHLNIPKGKSSLELLYEPHEKR